MRPSDRNPSNLVDRWLYRIASAAIGIEFLWGVIWSLPNIAIRLDLWPFEFDLGYRALIPTLSFGQEFTYFSGVLLTGLAFALILRKSAMALPVFFLAFLLDRTDWIVMTLNPLDGSHFSGKLYRDLFFLSLQLTAISLMTFLIMRNQLDRPEIWRRLLG